MRETSNAKAAPKSAWGVQARRRRAEHVAQHRPGPRASGRHSPPKSSAGQRRAGDAAAPVRDDGPTLRLVSERLLGRLYRERAE